MHNGYLIVSQGATRCHYILEHCAASYRNKGLNGGAESPTTSTYFSQVHLQLDRIGSR